MLLRLTLSVLLFFSNHVFAQPIGLETSEKINLKFIYQCGLINVLIGEAWFQSLKETNNNQLRLILEAEGHNLKTFDYFYKYISNYKACIDLKTSHLSYFERKVNRNGVKFEETYIFDPFSNYFYSRTLLDDEYKLDTLKFGNNVFDFLTAFQYLRFAKYDNMKCGHTLPISVLLENEAYPLFIKFLGIERVSSPKLYSYMCYKITIRVTEGCTFKSGETITAWISTDKKRLPVQINAIILIGTIKAYISDYENIDTSILLNIKSNK
jgi:hypothetical protein